MRSQFKAAPKHSAEALSSVPVSEKAAMCLTEKRGVFDKLCSGMSRSAVGHYEFNVKEPTVCTKVSLNRSTHNTGYVLIS